MKIGDKIKIVSDNDTYDDYRDKTWVIDGIYGKGEHPLYDMSVYPQKLIECNGLPFAIYEYEIEEL